MGLSIYSISQHVLQSPLVFLCRNREWKGLGFCCSVFLFCFALLFFLFWRGGCALVVPLPYFFFHPFSSTHPCPGSCCAHSMFVRDHGLSTIIPGIFGGPCRGEANGQIQVVDVADAGERWGLLFMYLCQPSTLFTYLYQGSQSKMSAPAVLYRRMWWGS